MIKSHIFFSFISSFFTSKKNRHRNSLSLLFIKQLPKIVISCVLVIMIVNLLLVSFAEMNYSYPREYRDGALIDIAHQFAIGSNPYTINTALPHTYSYGFLSPLLNALLSKILHLDLVVAQHVISLICIILICVLVSKEIFKTTKNIFLVLVSIIVVLLYTNVTLRPESLAILLTISTLYFVQRNKILNFKKILLVSLSIITLFYIKQYFILLFPVLIIYFIFNQSKKNLIYLLGTTFIFALSSFIIVSKIFPIYFTETIIIHINVTGGPSIWLSHRWNYVIKQSIDFIRLNWVIVLLFAATTLLGFVKNMLIKININELNKPFVKIPVTPLSNIYFIYCFVAIFFLTFLLGYHGGTYLTYYMQLLPIPLSIFSICYAYTALKKSRFREIIFLFLSILFIYEYSSFLTIPHVDRSKEQLAWNKSIMYINNHKPEDVYLPAIFITEAIKRGWPIYDNGQTEYYHTGRLSESTQSTLIFSFLSPHDAQIVTRFNTWEGELNYKTVHKKFSLIVLPEGRHAIINEKYLLKYYYLKQKMNLPFNYGDLGGPLTHINLNSIEFWEPR